MSLNPRLGAIALIACTLALPGCATGTDGAASADTTSASAPEATVVDARADGETHLQPGQLLAIELDSNASTGYAWEIVEDGRPVLEPAPVPASAKPAVTPMPGAGGTSRWRFRAAQPGTATLRLVYRRAWEKDVEPVRTASYTVIVE
ncbi:MAG: protease inhibitor I42 family protein [Pseudoxanthomonas sp.]